MATPKPNPYQVTRELIANAVNTARIPGESRRVTSLVAGSIGRFAEEMDDETGDDLLAHALDCIDEQDAGHVPALYGSLQAMCAARD